MTSSRNRTIGLAATVLLHALLLVFWIHRPASGTPPPAGKANEVEVTLLPPTSSFTAMPAVAKPEPVLADGEPMPPTGVPGQAVVACNEKHKKYQGIGIVYNPFTGIVLQAPTAYPAYKAGIRAGDRALMFMPSEDGHLLVDMQRKSGERFSVYIKPLSICYDEVQKKT